MLKTSDPDEATPAERQAFVTANAQVLAAARQALERPCRYPLGFTMAWWSKSAMPDVAAVRDLARAMRAEAKVAAAAGKPREAAACEVDIIRLAHALLRGGLYIDELVGDGVEGIGTTDLARDLPAFSATELTFLVSKLDRLASCASQSRLSLSARRHSPRWPKAGWDVPSTGPIRISWAAPQNPSSTPGFALTRSCGSCSPKPPCGAISWPPAPARVAGKSRARLFVASAHRPL